MIIYLNLEVLSSQLVQVGFHIKDIGLLDSALARPKTSLFGEDAYQTLELKGAALMHSIIKNHPMIDGNKRSSWIALNSFFEINGKTINADTEDAFEFVLAVATDAINLEQMASWIKDHTETVS
jgi:death-on-curing protein